MQKKTETKVVLNWWEEYSGQIAAIAVQRGLDLTFDFDFYAALQIFKQQSRWN